MILMHCFGTEKTSPVSSSFVVQMLEASGVHEIVLNTHNIEVIDDWQNLPIGYGNATWNRISGFIDLSNYQPIFNINLPKNVDEAISRVEKAIELNNTFPVKFEILNASHEIPLNSDVIKATKFLKEKFSTLKIWPLINPDLNDYNLLKNIGCEMIRVIGSPIGSNKGISIETQEFLKEIMRDIDRPVITIDGGMSGFSDIDLAGQLAVDRILFNSFLFKENNTISLLSEIQSYLAKAI